MPDGNNILDDLLDRELHRELATSPDFAVEILARIERDREKAKQILSEKWNQKQP